MVCSPAAATFEANTYCWETVYSQFLCAHEQCSIALPFSLQSDVEDFSGSDFAPAKDEESLDEYEDGNTESPQVTALLFALDLLCAYCALLLAVCFYSVLSAIYAPHCEFRARCRRKLVD
jgi:hypothetical protein